MPHKLELQSVFASYGATSVLKDVSLRVAAGGITALLGANGAGKTTTLRVISGVLRASAGRVLVDGEPLASRSPHAVAKLGVGHVPDGRGTLAELSVEDNLRVGGWLLPRDAQVREQAERMYEIFPALKPRRLQQAGTLSGGEQQMLAIARAMMPRPQLLLLDEPSFGVAPLVVERIFEVLRAINRSEGVSILLVEQNAKLALRTADYAYVLDSGRVALHGDSAQLRENETVQNSYLGA
ncbi:ABC transporter ATP-binding protein [Caenimonas aquaedulcis]|uniref:ABC transporter ATP-binding protein n=1 Tax=Caenimonas aquaedulcis TaxID=2793270 RepID=A0A931H3U7_9BURK|nr:ABC transporter ATP-binding protein [Caenimonas aquaedulcis]MBG9388061.1 ABC transporter ATP-binding protein [Caenimonas aquaedulcis]